MGCRSGAVPALTLAAAALFTASARGNPADTFGLGSRSTAMGGAVSASVTDFSANYYNPSGLALARGTDLSVGYMAVEQHLSMNGADSRVDPVHGVVGGAVARGEVLGMPFAFGLATHLPNDRLSRARTVRLDQPRFILYDNRPQLLYLSTNLAFSPAPWLAIGGGVTFLAATRGSFNITGTAVLPDSLGRRSEYDSQLRHEVDADLTAVRYPEAGVTVRPADWLALALVYRGQARVNLEISALLDGDVDAGLLTVPATYTLVSRTVNIFVPQQAVLGASVHPLEGLELGLDLTWVDWSSYESPVSRTATELDVPLTSLLPPPTKPSPEIDPGFLGRIVPRLGVEYRWKVAAAFELPLRAGYVYERSPVPEQRGQTNFVDMDRHLLSLGVGVVWKEPGEVLPGDLRLDAHVMYGILPTRVTLKDSPADFTGDYRASGDMLGLGATLSVGFR